jgi:hypothetical protein
MIRFKSSTKLTDKGEGRNVVRVGARGRQVVGRLQFSRAHDLTLGNRKQKYLPFKTRYGNLLRWHFLAF